MYSTSRWTFEYIDTPLTRKQRKALHLIHIGGAHFNPAVAR
jgi:hypothetical protein